MPTAKDILTQQQKVAGEVKKLQDGFKKLDTMFRKFMGEMDTMLGGLYEGKKHIEQLNKELTDAKTTFAKMSQKANMISKDVVTTGSQAKQMATMSKTYSAQCDKLAGELKRAGGTMQEISAASKGLADTKKAADACFGDFNNLGQMASGPPRVPTL